MSTITLELSPEHMQALERAARERGMSISAVIVELIDRIPRLAQAGDIIHDSIFNIRAHDTGAPTDLSENADRYLYGARKR